MKVRSIREWAGRDVWGWLGWLGWLGLLGLLGLCGVLTGWDLAGYGVFNVTEAKQAEIARQILVRQDWITPMFNGEVYFDKPILLHWLMAIGFSLLGLTEWAVRLPATIATIGLVLSTWWFVRWAVNGRVALLAATMLTVNPMTFCLGRTGQHDMLLVCFMTMALYCWYWAYWTKRRSGYVGFSALLGLAVMAKGPIALVLCGLIVGVFLLWVGWRPKSEQAKSGQYQRAIGTWGWGLLAFGGVTLPWYGLMLVANGWDFIAGFFYTNNVDRFVNVNLNQAGPWYYYVLLLPVSFFPWIVFLPSLLRIDEFHAWRSGFSQNWWRQRSPKQQLNLFMVVWFAVVLVFMSAASTKLLWYIYPGFPPFVYLCARAWAYQLTCQPQAQQTWGLWTIAGLNLLIAIGALSVPLIFPTDPTIQAVEQTGMMTTIALIHLIAALAIGVCALRRAVLTTWLISAIAFVFVTASVLYQLLPVLDQQISSGRMMPIARALQQETCDACPNDAVIAIGVVEPSLNFYSRLSQIQRIEAPYAIEDIRAAFSQSRRIVLVTTDTYLQAAGLDFSLLTPQYSANGFKIFVVPGGSPALLDTLPPLRSV